MYKKISRKVKYLLLSAMVLLLAGGCEAQDKQKITSVADGEMQVTYIDIGQGDATLIQTAEAAMLIDTGKYQERETLLNTLEAAGVEMIDYLLLTHPDADHIGSGNIVIDNYQVENVIMPDIAKDTACYTYTMEAIEANQINVITPAVGSEYPLGDANFIILSPEVIDENSANESSAGIKLVHGENSFLFCGDAEERSEKMMAAGDIDLECDVLKVSHHGSRTATSDIFLEAADPTWAVISCGRDNQYGMPHAEVLSKLEDDDVQVYRTDTMGTITAVSDGVNISWKSELTNEVPEAKTTVLEEEKKGQEVIEEEKPAVIFILNTRSQKIHLPACSSVDDIAVANRTESTETKEQLEQRGYTGCKRCNP